MQMKFVVQLILMFIGYIRGIKQYNWQYSPITPNRSPIPTDTNMNQIPLQSLNPDQFGYDNIYYKPFTNYNNISPQVAIPTVLIKDNIVGISPNINRLNQEQSNILNKSKENTDEIYTIKKNEWEKITKALEEIHSEKIKLKQERDLIQKLQKDQLNRYNHNQNYIKTLSNKHSHSFETFHQFWTEHMNNIFFSPKIRMNNDTLVSNKMINKDEDLITIPSSWILSQMNIKWTQLCSTINLLFKNEEHVDDICIATYWISKGSHTSNSWIKYFSSWFRKNYNTYPLFYTNKIKKLIKKTNFESEVNELNMKFKNEFSKWINKKVLSSYYNNEIDKAKYIKARLYTLSKTVRLKTENATDVVMLSPIIDKIEYSSTNNIYYTFNNNKLSVRATKAIPAGERLKLKYNNFSNKDLLIQTGTIVPKNPVPSSTYIRINSLFTDTKVNGTNIENTDDNNRKSTKVKLNGRWNLNKVWEEIRNVFNDKVNNTLPSDMKVEIKCLDWLRRILWIVNKNYKTNAKSDEIIWKNDRKWSLNERNAYYVMIEEKEWIEDYLKMVKLFEKILKNIEEHRKTDRDSIKKVVERKEYKDYFVKWKNIIRGNTVNGIGWNWSNERGSVDMPSNGNWWGGGDVGRQQGNKGGDGQINEQMKGNSLISGNSNVTATGMIRNDLGMIKEGSLRKQGYDVMIPIPHQSGMIRQVGHPVINEVNAAPILQSTVSQNSNNLNTEKQSSLETNLGLNKVNNIISNNTTTNSTSNNNNNNNIIKTSSTSSAYDEDNDDY